MCYTHKHTQKHTHNQLFWTSPAPGLGSGQRLRQYTRYMCTGATSLIWWAVLINGNYCFRVDRLGQISEEIWPNLATLQCLCVTSYAALKNWFFFFFFWGGGAETGFIFYLYVQGVTKGVRGGTLYQYTHTNVKPQRTPTIITKTHNVLTMAKRTVEIALCNLSTKPLNHNRWLNAPCSYRSFFVCQLVFVWGLQSTSRWDAGAWRVLSRHFICGEMPFN